MTDEPWVQRFVADHTAEGHPIVLDLSMSPATVIPCGSQGQAERVAAVLNAEFERADDPRETPPELRGDVIWLGDLD